MKIVLADDHSLFREGLCALLAREPGVQVLAVAADGKSAMQQVLQHRPDVLLTDISMPGLNGIECIRRLRAEGSPVRVLCLSMHADDRTVMAAIDAGASGYLLKQACAADLMQALHSVMAGRVYLSADLVGLLVELTRRKDTAAPDTPLTRLTGREREVAQLLAEGLTTKQIAARLFVSGKTVATHREHIMAKLGIRSIAELTRYAIQEGLSPLDIR
jgi:DNA-binding NarL/FixJ family response regulator